MKTSDKEFDRLTHRVVEFSAKRNWDKFHSVQNLSKSISIEANELLELSQWSDCEDSSLVAEELADVFIYCITLAQKLDFDIAEIIHKKLDINETKYPIDKSYGKSEKYDRL